MLSYKVEFRRLHDISLVDAYDEIGVYSLWSSRAEVRPSYIGEGFILDRFLSHTKRKWASKPINGVMGILQGDDPRALKSKAELIEYLLLWVAEDIDRFPRNNLSLGKPSCIQKLMGGANHNVIRLSVSGFDPLLAPERPPMESPKVIQVNLDHDELDLTHGWRRRPGS